MPDRSLIIKSRVLRNLTRRGLSLQSVQDEEIYSELTEAQNNILDDITPNYNMRFPKTSAPAVINADTDPVIPVAWDKALEYKAASEFLSGKDQEYFLARFEQQLKQLRASAQRSAKHEPLNRQPGISEEGREWELPGRGGWW
jgi:hypothetical protein